MLISAEIINTFTVQTQNARNTHGANIRADLAAYISDDFRRMRETREIRMVCRRHNPCGLGCVDVRCMRKTRELRRCVQLENCAGFSGLGSRV